MLCSTINDVYVSSYKYKEAATSYRKKSRGRKYEARAAMPHATIMQEEGGPFRKVRITVRPGTVACASSQEAAESFEAYMSRQEVKDLLGSHGNKHRQGYKPAQSGYNVQFTSLKLKTPGCREKRAKSIQFEAVDWTAVAVQESPLHGHTAWQDCLDRARADHELRAASIAVSMMEHRDISWLSRLLKHDDRLRKIIERYLFPDSQ